MGDPSVWSTARLPDAGGRAAGVTVKGLELGCEIPLNTATSFGLLAGSLSSCTAMSVRTFLQRWRIEPGEVTVDVAFRPGSPPIMDRRICVEAEVEPDLREQLATEVDHSPITVLLRDTLMIRTVLRTGARTG